MCPFPRERTFGGELLRVGMEAIREAADALERAESDLEHARADFWRAVKEAHENDGVSLVAIGRELGVSRQRVRQIILRADT